MIARVTITLKPGLLDAQGQTIHRALEALGFKGVRRVRCGKYLEIELGARAAGAATQDVERMCRRLLANPVIETYRIEVS